MAEWTTGRWTGTRATRSWRPASSSGTFISLTNTSDPTEFPLAAAVEGPQGLLDVSELVVNGSVYQLAFRQYDLGNGSVVGTTNLSKTAGSFEPSTATAAAVLLVPGTSIAVVTDPAKATVYGVDTANGSVTWSTALIGHATAVAYDPETGTVLVATTGASSVVALDPRSGQVNATTLVEENATGLAYDPLNNRVYVSENDPSTTVGGQVESFNASTLFDEELVAGFGADLRGVAFLPASGLVGVAGSSTALLYLLGQQLATPSLHTSAASTILTQSVTLTASAADGFAPYNYTYTGLPPGCTSANTSALVCMPTRAGSYTVFVHILDLTGATVSASVGFVVLLPVVAGIDLASGAPAEWDRPERAPDPEREPDRSGHEQRRRRGRADNDPELDGQPHHERHAHDLAQRDGDGLLLRHRESHRDPDRLLRRDDELVGGHVRRRPAHA